MNKLFEGARRFSDHEYPKYQRIFDDLKDSQNPHTLFITCSDSRIQPGLITQTKPGELFVVRNVANIVPPYGSAQNHPDTLSAIEFAVQVLEVENIVICGHSNCGGCRALSAPDDFMDTLPHTKQWIELAKKAGTGKEKTDKELSGELKARKVEQENIKLQINHLRTHSFILEREKKNMIHVYGWYYDIGQGKVLNFSFEKQEFFNISSSP